ncbi:MAG TPA: ATP-binding protein [Chloroflexota bacterium]|nr:ATP-binding protein [Chloroflexota bacterium]
MESIRDVLSRLAIPTATAAANTAVSSNSLACPACGGAGWLRLDVDIDDPRFGQTVPCSCKAKEIEEKKMRALLERSNLKALRDKTFSSFQVLPDLEQAFAFAQTWASDPTGWLVLLGGVGTGKTHLAAAIGNYRLEAGEPVLFMLVPDLLDHLRSTFAPSSEVQFDELFETVRDVPLLILDDLGTQVTTAWATEKLFQLLNHRYIAKLPTVITTNVELHELGERLASRMSDRSVSLPVTTGTIDWRQRDVTNPVLDTSPSNRRSRVYPRRGRL